MEAVAAVCRPCCGEACLVTWAAEAAGDPAVAGVEVDSVVEALAAVEVSEEALAAVVILEEADREEVGKCHCRLPLPIS